MGFLAANKIGPMKTDMDVDVTFEGDNTVMMQQVGRGAVGRWGGACCVYDHTYIILSCQDINHSRSHVWYIYWCGVKKGDVWAYQQPNKLLLIAHALIPLCMNAATGGPRPAG
jgi:hypothetical protein